VLALETRIEALRDRDTFTRRNHPPNIANDA